MKRLVVCVFAAALCACAAVKPRGVVPDVSRWDEATFTEDPEPVDGGP